MKMACGQSHSTDCLTAQKGTFWAESIIIVLSGLSLEIDSHQQTTINIWQLLLWVLLLLFVFTDLKEKHPWTNIFISKHFLL